MTPMSRTANGTLMARRPGLTITARMFCLVGAVGFEPTNPSLVRRVLYH